MKLTQIDSLVISDHVFLDESDYCLFLGEYTAYAGYGYSEINQLIYNFKKNISRKKSSDWQYKIDAINHIVDLFLNSNINFDINYTWVPIPPSKVANDPDYDDRLWQVLDKLRTHKENLDIRKLIIAKQNRLPSHSTGSHRSTINDRLNNWHLNLSQIEPKPQGIIIFDDIITTGASFKAAKKLLSCKFPHINILGIFIGRRKPSQNNRKNNI